MSAEIVSSTAGRLPPARTQHPLHIAFLTTEFVTEPSFDGGLSQYLGRVVRALRAAGHEPEVFVISDREETIDWESSPVHRLRVPRRRMDQVLNLSSRVLRRRWSDTVETVGTALALARGLRRRHSERPFDVAQATNLWAAGLLVKRFVPRLPLIIRLSSDDRQFYDVSKSARTLDRSLADRLGLWALSAADGACAPSRTLARWMRNERGVEIDLVPPVFEPPQLRTDPSLFERELKGRDYVLFFGTAGRVKGIDVLARAMRDVMSAKREAHLAVAGKDGSLGEPPWSGLELIRSTLGEFVERVHLLGKIPPAQLMPIIQGAGLVALPSRIDNLSNTCLEAMALGRVVIGTRGASFEELIEDGQSGFLVEREDPAGLARAIRAALDLNEVDRERIGRRAKERISAFGPAETIPVLEAYYRSAIERCGGRG